MKTRRRNGLKKRKLLMKGGTQIVDADGIYDGEVNAQGEKHGKGRMVEPDGHVYDGDWKNNKRDGNGKLTGPSGYIIYNGEYKDDTVHGYGVYNNHNITYRGEFANNKRHGMGYLTSTGAMGQGTTFGEFKDDKFVKGTGKRCQCGTVEEGDFENDRLKHGKRHDIDNNIEEGDFKVYPYKNILIMGKTTWPDGSVCVGTQNDESGFGVITYPDGSIYNGEFKNDDEDDNRRPWLVDNEGNKRHGFGTLTLPNGTRQTGHFHNDQFQRPISISQRSIFNSQIGPAGIDFSRTHRRGSRRK